MSNLCKCLRIRDIVGEPISTKGLDLSDRERLADQVRARVEQLLALGPVVR